MHPHCRCTTRPYDEDMESILTDADTRWARDPKTGKTYEVPMKMTYEEWRKAQNKFYGGDSVEESRKKLYNRGDDMKQWKEYIDIAGKQNMPKTLDDFQRLKYNKAVGYDWTLTNGYVDGIRRKEISALTGIETYQATARKIDEQLIGATTVDGVKITGYKTHFINRVIGDYQIGRKPVEAEKALFVVTDDNPKISNSAHDNKPSRTYENKGWKVTVNPETGILIQTNPPRNMKEGKWRGKA